MTDIIDTERELPKRIVSLRKQWYFLMTWWRSIHNILGILGSFCAVTVASQPTFFSQPTWALNTIAWVSVICIAFMTLLRPHGRANAYAKAWRLLNDACNRYAIDENYTKQSLLDAYTEGEKTIQESDPVG